MSQHTERFQRLLSRANINSMADLEILTQRKCEEKLQLPWDLVLSVQKRIRVWKMQMGDFAEQELEKGEQFYHEAPSEGAANAALQHYQVYERQMTPPFFASERTGTGAQSGPGLYMLDSSPKSFEVMQAALLEKVENMQAAVQKQHIEAQAAMLRKVEEMMSKSLQATKRSQEANIEGNLQQRLEELVSAASERVRTSAETVAMWKTFTIRGRI